MKKDQILDISDLSVLFIISLIIFLFGQIGLFAPVQSIVAVSGEGVIVYIRNSVQDIASYVDVFDNISEVREENIRLQEEVRILRDENKELKVDLDNLSFVANDPLVDFEADREIIPSRVITYDRERSGIILINKGSIDGVEENDILVIGEHLLGEINKVNSRFSEARLIATSNYNFNVKVLNKETRGILRGELGEEVLVTDILTENDLEVGDTFITEGDDGRYPYGLIVGKVEKIIGNPAEPLKEAELDNPIDFRGLDRVYIRKFR
jgi:rod shape-determining protein MreC